MRKLLFEIPNRNICPGIRLFAQVFPLSILVSPVTRP